MEVKVLFFASMRDRAGLREAKLELPQSASVKDLKLKLVKQFPGLQEAMSSILIAVNREFAFDDLLIPDGAEIAVFPPVSGG